ncbi:MAG: DUF177 domain-containing protein [Chloroflexota bacterium]
MQRNNLRFNFGYLIEASPGTTGEIEFDYPQIIVEDEKFIPLNGKFLITRTGEGILIQGDFDTTAEIDCIRCLELSNVSVIGRVEELFYYPPSSVIDEDAYVMGEDGNVDLGPLIRELALLERPMQPLCMEDCKGLCIECGTNLNTDPCSCEIDDIDPRLAKLKALLND